MFRTIIIFVILLTAPLAWSATIYVPSQQPTIQAGIDAASDDDIVMVAPGTYSGPGNYNIAAHGKAILICSETGPDNTIIDVQNLGNGFHFEGEGEGASTVIQGFTVRNAQNAIYLEDSSPELLDMNLSSSTGYGIYTQSPAGFILRDSRVSNNANGINLPIALSIPTIVDNCVFENNAGHAIFSRHQVQSLTITDSYFYGNGTACDASEIYSRWTFTIDNCEFEGNQTAAWGAFVMANSQILSGVNGVGGNLSNPYGGMDYSVSDCQLENLTGTVITPADQTWITNSIIRGNTGTIAEQMSWPEDYIVLTLSGCQIADNDGGISLSGYDVYLSMSGCRYTNNGGRLDYSCAFRGSCDISSSTFADNRSAAVSISSLEGSASISNTIVAFNGGSGVIAGSIIAVTCCDAYGNTGGNYVGMTDPTGTNGNISEDPLFCDMSGGDFRLEGDSPCLPDNNSCGVLIGALTVGCECCDHRGDANRDEAVDAMDIVYLVDWLWAGGPEPVCMEEADADGSDQVDAFDLLYLIQYMWNSGPAPVECPK